MSGISLKTKGSHARFVKAAEAQGWEVESSLPTTSGAVTVTAVHPERQDPKMAPDGKVVDIVATFYDSGAFAHGHTTSWANYIENEYTKRQHSGHGFTTLLSYLANGPRTEAERAAQEAVNIAKEAERSSQARVVLDAASATDEVRRMKQRFGADLSNAERSLKNALESIIGKAKAALEAIDQGVMTNNFGGGVMGGNHAVHEADAAAAVRNALLQHKEMVEHFFGEYPKGWS